MTRASTPPPPEHKNADRLPPSLPNSPLPKRLKSDTPSKMSSNADSTTTNTTAVPKLSSTSQPPLLIKKLSANASTPTRGSAFAAGYDLYAAKPITIPSRGKALVSTDLSIATPEGTYGRIAPRSGLAAKHFIDTGAGVIDADYRGEVKVLLFNHSEVDFEVKKGDRIAQLVLERIYTPDIVEVNDLEESVRGAGGFGSTG
ncbi:deoxyuridine 5'-triphosphate nucleotidohydrolase [Cladophialophora bantiana CBS 173.52]|uniref:Deoxyuridine 5'-triphosphate nucleotidohydrolase n=1 Tax=Cladophialophora bantiana (strain ATCC 10958 / CBS 173.52 / CDC B-1940 / NIH 8579) TaxID=1442370 RepID=A0A0D2ETA2_CLAB1|nr:deoxyuridine 5'-triphosphate nucleotidohydrolase [Cladophialophora bantiana CBS 173.52]KIW93141.1 deoxyuridine 5'-triphosphate nucleotidohydrolase [Cladophialophora bantiana CBS 173.52]